MIPNETVSLEESISSMPDSPQLNSPLASTAMMAMTPRTPISNQRLFHSASRRPFMSVDDNEGPCVFEISAFPPYFQVDKNFLWLGVSKYALLNSMVLLANS